MKDFTGPQKSARAPKAPAPHNLPAPGAFLAKSRGRNGGVVKPNERTQLLSRIPVLSELRAGQLRDLSQRTRIQWVEAKEELFAEGDAGATAYAIVSGKLEVSRDTETGRRLVIDVLGPGEFFGEIAMLAPSGRSASVTAVERSQLLAIDHRDLTAVLRSEPEVALALLRHLAMRLIALTDQATEIANLSLRLRLARKIARLARTFGDERAEGLWLPLQLSQEDWSEFVGVTREAINKQFRAWSEEGLLRVDSDGLMILDRARFAELGNCAPL